tara:strand:+ start:5191 stop:5460 length:270 start_codon:yes stop_codon:yes gene_type:complete
MKHYKHVIDDDLKIDFEFDYVPGEHEIKHNPDGSGYPGSNSEVTLHFAWIVLENAKYTPVSVNILPHIELLMELSIEDITQKILENYEM